MLFATKHDGARVVSYTVFLPDKALSPLADVCSTTSTWSERVRHQLPEQRVLVDLQSTRAKPGADVRTVTLEEVHTVQVADQVDDLR